MPTRTTTQEKETSESLEGMIETSQSEVDDRKRILITSADEHISYWKEHTEAMVRAYAEKCEAELIIIPKTKRPNNTWVLFDAWEKSLELGNHNYAWIDMDIVIADDAPNIFELDDKLFFCQPDPIERVNPKWRKNHMNHAVPNCRPYPVTAMVKWSTRHIEKLLEWSNQNQHTFPRRFGDQEIVAAAIYHTESSMFYFPAFWHKMSKHLKKDTVFGHAAGNRKPVKINTILTHMNKNGKKPIKS
jgi:hypothetical protein